ncbi:MAG: 2OG-Fe(II) oxygenase [Alphaproteobacteria bacterium]|nr:2OG-Fe(II) oxygenase [Alphaproteobacteria bacterium]MCB9793059.1 2OG-Fe(II) oxygenase [Alphaproteobacteria bacterium]
MSAPLTRTDYKDGRIFTLSPVLSAAERREFIDWSEAQGFDFAPVTTGLGMIPMPHVRNNNRVMVDDVPRAEGLWARIREGLPEIPGVEYVGLNERLRVYRYQPGQYFKRHLDGAYHRGAKEFSIFTLLVWLNDDYQGGETRFGGLSFSPTAGDALLFAHRQLHEGDTVLEGVKYMLRTDVMVRV